MLCADFIWFFELLMFPCLLCVGVGAALREAFSHSAGTHQDRAPLPVLPERTNSHHLIRGHHHQGRLYFSPLSPPLSGSYILLCQLIVSSLSRPSLLFPLSLMGHLFSFSPNLLPIFLPGYWLIFPPPWRSLTLTKVPAALNHSSAVLGSLVFLTC